MQVGLVDCVYTPLVTLCVFLGQVLSADHSCRAAVAHLIAYRVAQKQRGSARRKRAPTAKPANGCRKSSSRRSRRQRGAGSMPTRNRVGCGRIDACTFSTVPPSRCLTPTRIKKPIPNRRSKNPVDGVPKWQRRAAEFGGAGLLKVSKVIEAVSRKRSKRWDRSGQPVLLRRLASWSR